MPVTRFAIKASASVTKSTRCWKIIRYVLAAAGVALGALLGALVPQTEPEDRLFSDVSDHITGEAKHTAQSAVEQTRDSLDPESSAAESS